MNAPRYLARIAPEVSAPRNARALAAAARDSLPIDQYLFLAHTAAVQGVLLAFTPEGKIDFQNSSTIPPDLRLRLLEALINKVLPGARPIALPNPAPLRDTDSTTLRELTDEELRAMADGPAPTQTESPVYAEYTTDPDETDDEF